MGVKALCGIADYAVVPRTLSLVERYTKLKWFFLLYPIII
jgi:hypothetical protein